MHNVEKSELTQEQVNAYLEVYQTHPEKEVRDEAGMKLYNSVYKYIISILSKNFATYYSRNQMDLISVATVCFFDKINDYDSKKGRLTTYIRPHIVHSVLEYIDGTNNQTSYYGQMTRKIKKAIQELKISDIPIDEIVLSEKTKLPIHTIRECLKQIEFSSMVSLDCKGDETKEEQNQMYISNHLVVQESVEDQIILREEKKSIDKALRALSEDEEKIIRLSFGLGYPNPLTDAKISAVTGIKVDKIKRVKNIGLEKLSNGIKREGLFNDRIIRHEIDSVSEEISFVPSERNQSLEQLIGEIMDINF